jgi:hypothetical protein
MSPPNSNSACQPSRKSGASKRRLPQKKARWPDQEYFILPVEGFNFRHRYQKLKNAGVKVSAPSSYDGRRRLTADSDFRRDNLGNLVVRISTPEHQWIYCLGIKRNGSPVPDSDLDSFVDYISERLINWAVTYPDEYPVFLYQDLELFSNIHSLDQPDRYFDNLAWQSLRAK